MRSSSSSVPHLAPLDASSYDDFWSLFQQAMQAKTDSLLAALGLTAEEYERLPLEVGELLQIESEGATVGYVWLELRERELHVHALLLEPRYRGHGIGGRVLQSIIEAYGNAVDVVELGVEPGNAAARAVYERAGFTYVGERLGFLIMRRRLDTSMADTEPPGWPVL